MTYSGDNYPGHQFHVASPPEAVALSIGFHENMKDALLQMFSGEMPEVGATYGYRACSVTDASGVITVEMRFVRI